MLAFLAAAAHAQSARFDGQLFRPSSDAQGTTWVEDTHVSPDGYATARAYLETAVAPVRTRTPTGEPEQLVSGLFGTQLAGAFHYGGFRFGAGLPVYGWAGGALARAEPGLGDLAVDVKGRILDRARAPVGFSMLGRMLLPTASVEVPLGAEGIGWELVGVVDRTWDDLTFAGNFGTRGVPRVDFGDHVWNDAVFARLGVSYAVNPGAGFAGEVSAQTNWASGRNPGGTPAEAMASAYGRMTGDLVFRGGVSVGLSRSPGAPITRLVAGVGFEPDPYPDTDLDGVVDRADWCPLEAEDPDGFEDADGCFDRAVAIRVAPRDAGGDAVAAVLTLEGPEYHRVDPGDDLLTLHPGTYAVTAVAAGFEPWSGQVVVPLEPGWELALPLVAEAGTLRVWAVDAAGEPVRATMSVSGGPALPVDGAARELPIGEHAVVVSAPGYEAVALSVVVTHGGAREIPVVLARAPEPPPEPRDDRVGRR